MGFVYIRNKGGTGNQLFIYNFGLLLSSKFNLRLIIDNTTGFLRDAYGRSAQLEKLLSETPRQANLFHHFSFVLIRKSPSWLLNLLNIRYITERSSQDFIHLNSVNRKKPIYIYADGYFQSNNYLIENNYLIVDKFNYLHIFSSDYYNYNTSILNSESVCVHVRRKEYDNLLSKEYYEKAFILIKQKVKSPMFFIFSDDLEWCKRVFKNERVIFIDNLENTDDIQEFRLMVNCKHFIIANSTFSWWAAIFGKFNYKLVIAPLNNQLASKEFFYHKDWIQI